jgi:putative NIF3 family GTP cyclohydrolase 1 type 2
MEAKKLYGQLEKDFIKSGLSDDWAQSMEEVKDFLSENFKERSMGLVCDFSEKVNKVYAAVFPSRAVMQRILDDNVQDAMLFVHHPSIWDIRKAPKVFQQMERDLLQKFKDRRISIYNLHVPLDNYGEYSTSVTLAEKLGIEIEKACSPYFGSLSGVIGKTSCRTVQELKDIFEKAVGHEIKLYDSGENEIEGGRVAVLAGGGNNLDYLGDTFEEGIKTIITGISSRNPHSEKTHAYEEANGINVLGGTHYSTERFACEKMCEYFRKLELPCEFIGDEPVMEDM